MKQLGLLGEVEVEAEGRLTERQRSALEVVGRLQPVAADEIGAALCERRGKHPADQRCDWDAQSGREVLRALQRKGLVTRKRDAGWVLVGYTPPRETAPPPTGLDEHGFPKDF